MSEWTKEPPKEPGWYWTRVWRGPETFVFKIAHVEDVAAEDGSFSCLHVAGDPWPFPFRPVPIKTKANRLWWPIAIPPPPDEKENERG
jgi:hypothetical protein